MGERTQLYVPRGATHADPAESKNPPASLGDTRLADAKLVNGQVLELWSVREWAKQIYEFPDGKGMFNIISISRMLSSQTTT